jgi:hypothetical protein
MPTLNGIGTTLLSIKTQNEPGEKTATRWITFLYLPIAPIKRLRVRLLPHQGSGFSYEEIGQEPLNWREIAQTYLYGWFLFPLLIFWPIPIAVIEVWTALGLPQNLHTPFFIFTILWMLTAVWKLSDWHEDRGHHPLRKFLTAVYLHPRQMFQRLHQRMVTIRPQPLLLQRTVQIKDHARCQHRHAKLIGRFQHQA